MILFKIRLFFHEEYTEPNTECVMNTPGELFVKSNPNHVTETHHYTQSARNSNISRSTLGPTQTAIASVPEDPSSRVNRTKPDEDD
jgi:hypothetical protein